jgi:hypothetical protein
MLGKTVLRRAIQRQVRQFSAFENKNTIKETRNKYYTNNTAGTKASNFSSVFFKRRFSTLCVYFCLYLFLQVPIIPRT